MAKPVIINPYTLNAGITEPNDLAPGAGTNRLLIACGAFSHSSALLTGLSYGGIAMQQLIKIENNNTSKLYLWYALETEIAARANDTFVVTGNSFASIMHWSTVMYADALQAMIEFNTALYLQSNIPPYDVTITGITDSLGFSAIHDQENTATFTWFNSWIDEGQTQVSNSAMSIASKDLVAGAETASATPTPQQQRKAIIAVRIDPLNVSPNNPPVVDTPTQDQICTIGIPFGPLDISGNFSDPDSDPLTFSQSGLPNGLTISSVGVISGTPTGGFS